MTLQVGDKIRVAHYGNVFDGWTGEIIKINDEGPFPVWANIAAPDGEREDDVPLHADEVVVL